MTQPAPPPPPGAPGTPDAADQAAQQYMNQFHFTAGPKSSAPAGNGFAMDPAEMRQVMDEFTAIRDEVVVSMKNAEPLWTIKPPGNDPASIANAEQCNKSGMIYRETLNQQRALLTAMIGKMREALGMMTEMDEQHADQMKAQQRKMDDAPPGPAQPAPGQPAPRKPGF